MSMSGCVVSDDSKRRGQKRRHFVPRRERVATSVQQQQRRMAVAAVIAGSKQDPAGVTHDVPTVQDAAKLLHCKRGCRERKVVRALTRWVHGAGLGPTQTWPRRGSALTGLCEVLRGRHLESSAANAAATIPQSLAASRDQARLAATPGQRP